MRAGIKDDTILSVQRGGGRRLVLRYASSLYRLRAGPALVASAPRKPPYRSGPS